jgi:hypothetical protein
MDKNNLLLIQLDQLIKKQFANIGDIIGDCLMSIEVNRALIITNPDLMKQVRDLINECAAASDKVLDDNKTSPVHGVTDLVKKLLVDLEKIKNS